MTWRTTAIAGLDLFRRRVEQNEPLAEIINDLTPLRSELEVCLAVDDIRTFASKLKDLDVPLIDPTRAFIGPPGLLRDQGLRLLRNVALAIGIALLPIVIAFFEGNLINPSLEVDAAHAYGYWANNVLGLATIVFFLGLYFGELPRTLSRLALLGPFKLSAEQWRSFVQNANRLFGLWFVRWVPVIVSLAVILWAYGFFLSSDLNHWVRPANATWGSLAGLLNIWVVTFILIYLIAVLLTGLVVTYVVLKSLFRHDLDIHPLHPDDCGGLRPLGSLSMRINALVLPFGIIVGINLWHNATSLQTPLLSLTSIVIVLAYVVGAATLVFLPLLAAHQRMKSARQSVIDRVSRRFQELNTELMAEIDNGRSPDEQSLSEIERVRQVYAMAAEMPVFPFTLRNVTAFFAAIAPPVLLFLLEFILSDLIST